MFHFAQALAGQANPVHIPALGLELAVPLPGSVSDQALTILETTNAPGFGPPLHRHRETEVFRVLEGKYLYEVDGRRFEANAGDTVSVPGGAAHTFRNIAETPSRQFILMLPAMDAVAFFCGLADVFAAGKPDMATLNRYGEPWGVEFLGPPLKVTP